MYEYTYILMRSQKLKNRKRIVPDCFLHWVYMMSVDSS